MIDFEEELRNFELSIEVEEAEDAIHLRDLTDVVDILREMQPAVRGWSQQAVTTPLPET